MRGVDGRDVHCRQVARVLAVSAAIAGSPAQRSPVGDFVSGVKTITEQVSATGDFLTEQASRAFSCPPSRTSSRKQGGSLAAVQRLFVRVQSGELTPDEAMWRAEKLLGEESSGEPGFMSRIKFDHNGGVTTGLGGKLIYLILVQKSAVAEHLVRLSEEAGLKDEKTMTTRIIDIHAAVLVPQQQAPEDPAMGIPWMAVLKSLNAYQMYQRHVSVHARSADVVNYLLKDPHFPRTVRRCLDEVEACLAELPHNMQPLARLRIAQRRLEAMQVESLAPALRHEYLDAVQTDLMALHAAIEEKYFQLHAHCGALPAAANA